MVAPCVARSASAGPKARGRTGTHALPPPRRAALTSPAPQPASRTASPVDSGRSRHDAQGRAGASGSRAARPGGAARRGVAEDAGWLALGVASASAAGAGKPCEATLRPAANTPRGPTGAAPSAPGRQRRRRRPGRRSRAEPRMTPRLADAAGVVLPPTAGRGEDEALTSCSHGHGPRTSQRRARAADGERGGGRAQDEGRGGDDAQERRARRPVAPRRPRHGRQRPPTQAGPGAAAAEARGTRSGGVPWGPEERGATGTARARVRTAEHGSRAEELAVGGALGLQAADARRRSSAPSARNA